MSNLTLVADVVADIGLFKASLDDFFLIIMGILVWFLQCGFAFFEAGAIRSKNVTNILIKNMLDSFIGALAYYILGYALAFGEPGNPFCGAWNFAMSYLPFSKYSFWFFQFAFAATAATIVSGAVAERCEFWAYMIYSFVISGFVYPVVTHWAWGGGWLANGIAVTVGNVTLETTYQDFAGSGVVHVVGGSAALVGSAFLGPRIGRFVEGRPQPMVGHSVPFAALGGFILFLGFFAFNGGSQASISQPGDGEVVAQAVVNTVFSGSIGGFVTLIFSRSNNMCNGKWSLLNTINGALAGMVGICAGAHVILPYGALVVGFFSALSYLLISHIVSSVGIDDPLNAVGVHLGAGMVGVISVPFLNHKRGILYMWDRQSGLDLLWNIIGLFVIAAWSSACSVLLFGGLKLGGILRVPEEYELKGLDIPKHGEPAYPLEAYEHGWENANHGIGMLPLTPVPKMPCTEYVIGPEDATHPETEKGYDNRSFSDSTNKMEIIRMETDIITKL